MTQEQVLKVIEKIASSLSYRFRFGYYDQDDIKQEIFIMGLDALDRYDGRAPLENFLAVHIRNRLKSLKRDKYHREGYVCSYCNGKSTDCQHCHRRMLKNSAKKYLVEPLDICDISDESEPNMWHNSDTSLEVIIQEYVDLIDKYLNVSFRIDYLKMRAGAYVPKQRRIEVETEINRIIEANDEEG